MQVNPDLAGSGIVRRCSRISGNNLDPDYAGVNGKDCIARIRAPGAEAARINKEYPVQHFYGSHMRVPIKHYLDVFHTGLFMKQGQTALDIITVTVCDKKFPAGKNCRDVTWVRRCEITITGYLYDAMAGNLLDKAGVFDAITQMEDTFNLARQFQGFEGQRIIPVGIR